jgi:hypothetical protein
MKRLRSIRVLLLSLTLLSLAGCGADSLESRRAELDDARQRWQGGRPEGYEMTFRVECGFCYWSTPRTTVLVEGEQGPAQEPDTPGEITVDVLFDAIDQWLSGGPIDRYDVTYDLDLGYPTFISIEGDVETSDDEWTFSLVSFESFDSG